MRLLLSTALVAFLVISVKAQKTYYVDSAGNLYWNKAKPVYLFVSDNPEGKEAHRLKSESTPKYADPFYLDTEGVNYVRTRDAVDPETGQVVPDMEVMYEIYADGLAPVTQAGFNQKSSYAKDGIKYFTSGVKVGLQASDEMSGVESIQYAVNGSSFKPYTDSLSFEKDGRFTIRYFTVDNVGNKEEAREVKFSIDPTPPETSIKVKGMTKDSVIAGTSEIYIVARDTLSGVSKVFYQFDDGEFQPYSPQSKLPIGNLSEGEHTLKTYATDYLGNKGEAQEFNLYLDLSPPLMVSDILGDRFIVEDQIYFSGRTKLKLTAVDNKVGVKEIKYSIDGGEYQTYTQPFYLPSVAGLHSIKYYSVDNLDNTSLSKEKKSRYVGRQYSSGPEEFTHNVNKIYVDMTGPEVEYKISEFSFVRDDTLFISPYSKITLSATDTESGLKEIRYSFNDELGERVYEGPFSFEGSGFNTLSIYGYDNVNNRNLGKFTFVSDTEEPEIFVKYTVGESGTKNDLPIYPEGTGIFLSASDKLSGVGTLTYSLNKEAERNYAGIIKNLKKGKNKLEVTATDILNNSITQEFEFFIK
jgi:hypothetical protein